MRAVCGSRIAMIFQEPGSALNPVFTIGDQLAEGIMIHRRQEGVRLAVDTMDRLLENNNSNKMYREGEVLIPFFKLFLTIFRSSEA